MKISYNWLKTHIDFNESPDSVAAILTSTGLEVEAVIPLSKVEGGLSGVVIGYVLDVDKHPDADRLSVTKVDVGTGEPLQIVCGAKNVVTGQKVLVATVGSILYAATGKLEIKNSKIRGVSSEGMICAEDELGLGTSHDGIIVMPESAVTGDPASNYFDLITDYLFEIGLTPNRSDAMSHLGVAKDLKAWLNVHKNQTLQFKHTAPDNGTLNPTKVKVSVIDKTACPRYAGAVIRGITVKPSPDWLQSRLKSIGLNPVNNIVDSTNFVLHNVGNPLHAFDLKKVGSEIVVRPAKSGEKLTTLDGIERKLNTEDLVICNATEPMCLAGIFGGIDSGVTSGTTDIFLEAACFNPVQIRKSARRHSLSTDSSFRFERGVDQNSVLGALWNAVDLIIELAGGQLEGGVDLIGTPKTRDQISFSANACRKFIGADISTAQMVLILRELEFEILGDTKDELTVTIPEFRIDVTRDVDVYEEILRIYGFDQIAVPEKLHYAFSIPTFPTSELIYNNTSDLLVALGFYELTNNSIVSEPFSKESEKIRILNPLSSDLDSLRTSLLFGGLRNIAYNQNRQNPDLKLFEFGKTYHKTERSFLEENQLGIWVTGKNQGENWNCPTTETDFETIKAIVVAILERVGLAFNVEKISSEHLEPAAEIRSAGQKVGSFGQVAKDWLKKSDVKNPVYFANLNWDLVLSLIKSNKITFQPLPKTHFIRRDFSLLIDEKITFSQIREIAFETEKRILQRVGLFDVYKGKDLGTGKKSYAVSFVFQDPEITLKDQQIDETMEKIRLNFSNTLGAVLR